MEDSIDGLSEVCSEISKWSDRDDVKLLYSMFDLKPVGLYKHFSMIEIVNNLNELQKSEGLPLVTPSTIWTRLNELYNLKMLEEYELLQPQYSLDEFYLDHVVEDSEKVLDDSDDDKPLAKKLSRSESEESKVSVMELETDETNNKASKNSRKKSSLKTEENISSEEEPAVKSLRSRGGGLKSKSPVTIKKRK